MTNAESANSGKAAGNQTMRDALLLSMVPGVGPRLYRQLVEHFGSPASVLDAGKDALAQLPGIGKKAIHALTVESKKIDVDAELLQCHQHGIEVIDFRSPSYPANLAEIYDPPAILFRKGTWNPANQIAIAIVGTRHASNYGIRQAERIASGLARAGVTIVSGLARGIDAAAHRGALSAGGETLAVLGGGLLNMYPPEHADLANQIVAQGCLLSEMPPLSAPRSSSFPRRNRIISGICLGVVVVEAAERSGSLITARHAMEQNREVFAVPGSVELRVSKGPHQLIRDGATLVETIDDILEQLGPLIKPIKMQDDTVVHNPAELQLDDQQRVILDAIDVEPTAIDTIVNRTELPVNRVLASISILEMRHLIRRVSGSSVARI
jgi:DNA processing protein